MGHVGVITYSELVCCADARENGLGLESMPGGWVRAVCEYCGDEWVLTFTPGSLGKQPVSENGQQALPLNAPLVHRGLPNSRRRRLRDQLEDAFAGAWESEANRGTLRLILAPPPQDKRWVDEPYVPPMFHEVTQQISSVVATMMQWLGTSCGMGFLTRVLEDNGYKIQPPPYARHEGHCDLCPTNPYGPQVAGEIVWTKKISPPFGPSEWVRYHPHLPQQPICSPTRERLEQQDAAWVALETLSALDRRLQIEAEVAVKRLAELAKGV